MDKDLMLVGSVPLDTAEEVFHACGSRLGTHLAALPDGETDERIWWVTRLAYRVFHGHPQLDTLHRPPAEDGVESWRQKTRDDWWSFKVKPGETEVRFGDPGWRLGYTKDAIASYFVFKTLREKGQLPPDLRFQISLPLTNSAIDVFFHHAEDYPKVKPGFEQAMRTEIEKILERIPAEDLTIQWDCCVEVMDLEDSFPWTPDQGKLERNVGPAERLSPAIPETVQLGYHLCYGTLGGWPMVQPKDLSHTVEFANEVVRRSGRRVDFIHIPILDTEDEAYFAPLKDLSVGSTRIYFGVIHGMEDEARFRRRLENLRRHVKDFGIAAPCGFGRHGAGEVPALLEEHLRAAEMLENLQ